MKSLILKIAAVSFCAVAIAQSVAKANAEQTANQLPSTIPPAYRIQVLFDKESALEQVGASLGFEDRALLIQSLQELTHSLKDTTARTDSPTI